jgi:hypothetical protein
MIHTRLGRIVSAALALGILLALRLPTLHVPIINVDEADFAVEAGVLLDGGRPYVDFVEKKPPLIYAAYAGALALVGRYNLPGLRLLLLGYILATALVLAAIARRLSGERAALIAAPAYAVMVSAGPPRDVHAANPETFFLLPLLLGTWLSLPPHPGSSSPAPALRTLFAAGVCLGAASLFKQQAGMQLPILLTYLLARPATGTVPAATSQPRGWREWRLLSHPNVRSGAALLTGFASIWAVTVAALAAMGALGEFYYWTIDVNRYYIANGNNLHDSVARFRGALLMLASFVPVLWVAGACGLAFHLVKNRWRHPLLPVWLLASLVPIVLGGRFFPHYFLQLYPPLVLLAAVLVAHLWDLAPARPTPRVACAVAALGLVALGAVRLEARMTRLIDPEIVSIPHATPRARALARYVREHTAPEARILVWGYGSALYHLAQRRPATRFPYVTYLVGAVEGTPTWWSPFHPSRALEIPRAWSLFFQDFERHPPELVIDTASAGYFGFQKFPVEKYPGLMRILDAGYQRTEIEGFAVWKRRPSTTPSGLAASLPPE